MKIFYAFMFLFLMNNAFLFANAATMSVEDVACMCDPVFDSLALVALYNSTDGANWTNTWDLEQPMSTWHGVNLNGNGCIDELVIFNNQLSGVIPSELGSITSLTGLNLQNNELSGSIPVELGNLTNLVLLALSGNELSGSIPVELGNLTNLMILDLQNNELSGSIPVELGNLANLVTLSLRNNQLQGCFPQEFDIFCDIDYNFTGNPNLPNGGDFQAFCSDGAGFCSCTLIDSLALVALYNATDGANWTNTWDLGQPMSTWSGVLLNGGCVEELHLHANQLSGSIPPELGNLTNLFVLNLYNNELSGGIPPELGNLTNLVWLSLHTNQLSGGIPAELGNLTGLGVLFLSNNQLSGMIPEELANLTSLNALFLFNNQLEGCFPQEFNIFCNISYNLTGNPNLPNGGDFQAFCSNNTGACSVLPLDLLTFNAKPTVDAIVLNWTSTNEKDLTVFEVERSKNGQDFMKIGQQTATNHISTIQKYAFNDKNVQANTTYYYRLKMLENDGQFHYSKIVIAELKTEDPNVQLFPNLVKQQCFLKIKNPISTPIDVMIFNAYGQIIQHFSTSKNQHHIDTTIWTHGLYYVQVTQNQKTTVLRLVKE